MLILRLQYLYSNIYSTLDFLILSMRFNFHMLQFLFFKNYTDFQNPLTNCIFHIADHLFLHSRRFNLNCFLHWPDIIAASDFAMDFIFWIRVLIREIFVIIEVALSTTITFSQYSHNMRLLCLFIISQTWDDLLFCIPNTNDGHA